MRVQTSIAVSLLLYLMSIGAHARAVESAVPQDQVAAPADEQAELQLLYEESDLVTATRRVTPLHKAPAIATVITADEIRNMGARNLRDVLKMVPGIGISTNAWGVNMVEVRGIRTSMNDKILVMIDGHSLNRNINGSALYQVADALPVENIRQMEVVRGPGSALYGSSAFVATINVITHDADEIDGVEAKIDGGSFDTFKGNLVGAVSSGDKLAASGSFDYFRTNGPKLHVESDALRSTPFSMAPGTAHLDAEQTDAFLKVIYGDLSFRGHYLTSRKGYYIGMGNALTDDSYSDKENYWGELAYDLRLSGTLAAHIKLSYDHYGQDSHVKIFPNGFGGGFPQGMIGNPQVKDRTFGTEIQVDWAPFKGNRLIVGLAYEGMQQYYVKQMANFNPLTYADIGAFQEVADWNRETSRQIWATYLQDEWQLLERLNLTAGVRYDHYSDFGGTINPRAALVWNLLDEVDLKLLYGRAFRAPSFQELYDINNPAVLGNPALKPERIETWEAGATYRLSRALNIDLNYFYSAIDNLINKDSSVTPAVERNIGKSVTQGVELGLNGSAFTTLQWRATYAWQAPRDDLTGQRLPYVPAHRATGSLNYALTRNVTLHTDLHWTGPRPRDTGDTRAESPSYTTVDLAATAHDFYKGLEIQVAVHNLFDKRYSDPDTSGAAQKIPGDYPREGISVLANLLYKF
ncbi:iron-regulated outer membrane virulence protein [Geobacter sp. OR-1]|uniref:TonB-dependent receptor plug domain-containing protein n=1 Tax=Geobacter sp. OR-1 TaxID=1266765 RepID=UPI0005422FFF|nr:TonB-dependent receptor [Geobacter sp. OR-1]GAM10787.1 iron-regulated outer membrane virulence protein [Geobacter sp. OR-1]